MAPVWLTVAMVRAMHAEQLAMFGGAGGIRDEGLLESALDRPRNLFAYGDAPSLFEFAAAYTLGIIRNHPFVDGNKRTGLLAGIGFLDLNGYDFAPDETDIVNVILAAAAGEADETLLAGWFSDYARRKSP
jgi:death-on-curing protein